MVFFACKLSLKIIITATVARVSVTIIYRYYGCQNDVTRNTMYSWMELGLQDHCNYNWIVFRFRLYCMKFAIFSSLDIHVIMSHNYIMLMNQWYLRISCFLPELHLNTINTDRNTYSMWSPTMSYWKSTLISWI